MVRVCRVYDPPSGSDGWRVLVDRVWPRGVRKDSLALDEWAKDVAPSTELRKWYGHAPERFEEFTRRYQDELTDPARAEALTHLRQLAKGGNLTLLTASKAVDISEAVVLAAMLR